MDNWRPLFAISEVVGGPWPSKVEKAYTLVVKEVDDEQVIGPMILRDIKTIFSDEERNYIFSADLAEKLVNIEERPWAEWKRGRPLNSTSLARLLKPYGIASANLRFGGVVRKGYKRERFEEAWTRYLPSTLPPI